MKERQMSRLIVYIAILAVINRYTFVGLVKASSKLGVATKDSISFSMNVMRVILLLILIAVIGIGGAIE